jgi:hypothetical protein
MEDRKFLRCLPPFLRNVPNFGASVAAGITLLAWGVLVAAPLLPRFQGEGGVVPILLTAPIIFLGFSADVALGKALGFDGTTHPYLTQMRLFIFTMVVNVVVVWVLLKFFTATFKRLRNLNL